MRPIKSSYLKLFGLFLFSAMNIGISSCDRNKIVIYSYEIESCSEVQLSKLSDNFEFEKFRYSKAMSDIECKNLYRYTMKDKNYDPNSWKAPELAENPYVKLYNDGKVCRLDIAFTMPYWLDQPYQNTPMYSENAFRALSYKLNIKTKDLAPRSSILESKKAFLKYCDIN